MAESKKDKDERRDEVLKRLLKTPPTPKKKPAQRGEEPSDLDRDERRDEK